MDFLKNNWGFLLLALILCGALVTVGVFCGKANATFAKERADVKTKNDYLASVVKKKIKLSDEDIAIAESNQKIAAQGLEKLRKDISEKFVLEYTVPDTEIEALRKLKDEISAMRKLLDDKEIYYSDEVEYFTFDDIALSTQPPHKDDLNEIFRQLTIIKYVVSVAAEAGVVEITKLVRPMGLAVPEEGIYKFTPVEIEFYAPSDKAQRFINLMSRADKYLFYLNYMELYAEDINNDIAMEIDDTAVNAPSSQEGGSNSPSIGGGVGLGNVTPFPSSRGGSTGGAVSFGGSPRGGRKDPLSSMGGAIDLIGGGPGRGGRGGAGMGYNDRGRGDKAEDGKIRRRGLKRGMDGIGGGNPLDMMGGGMMGMGQGYGMNNNGKDANGIDLEEYYNEPVKRQDLLVYTPKEALWSLRYDLIEVNQNKDEAENEDSEDSGSDDGAEDNTESAE